MVKYIRNKIRFYITLPLKKYLFEICLSSLGSQMDSVIIVGANDGFSFDPWFPMVLNSKAKLFLVEPLEFFQEKLRSATKNREDTVVVPYAISNQEGSAELSFVDTRDSDAKDLPSWAQGLGSLNPEKTVLSGKKINQNLSQRLKKATKKVSIQTVSAKTVIEKYHIGCVSYLQVDTEGHDSVVIESFLDSGCRPKLVKYEYVNLLERESLSTEALLKENGYVFISKLEEDVIAVHRSFFEGMVKI